MRFLCPGAPVAKNGKEAERNREDVERNREDVERSWDEVDERAQDSMFHYGQSW